eukprot:999865-Prymnesium_polylepis.1
MGLSNSYSCPPIDSRKYILVIDTPRYQEQAHAWPAARPSSGRDATRRTQAGRSRRQRGGQGCVGTRWRYRA